MQVFLFKASLAWRNLFYHKQQFFAAILAVAFAVILMFTQLGFRDGILDSNVAFIQKLNADLIIVNSQRNITTIERQFKKIRLYQARELLEVIAAYPFYISTGFWKNQQTKQERVIRIFGFNPRYPVFLIPEIDSYINNLQLPNTVLADAKSRKAYGSMQKGDTSEVSGRRFRVVGNFVLGTDFVADGNLIMSDQNFLRLFSEHPSGFSGKLRPSLDEVDLGLLKVFPGTDLTQIVKKLSQFLPGDIKVFTKQDYVAREVKFYSKATLGFVFNLGALIGFVIGAVFVYNIIAKDIKQNLAQYGTLRAIGHSNMYLLNVILLQSILIAIIGFVPGLCSSILFCDLLSYFTGLLIQVKFEVGMLVFMLTISMCAIAGIIAARKLQKIDPADIYDQKFGS